MKRSPTPHDSFTVGKFYRVPCVKAHGSQWDRIFRREWIPVMGPEHRDAEIVQFPHSHWHVDWRFASERVLRRAVKANFSRQGGPFNYVLQRYGICGGTEDHGAPFVTTGDVVMRRVKCRRPMPDYPRKAAFWMTKLEDAFAQACMKNMVCPHRGMPLEGCERDGDVVICPGHGLRWNVKTGALVRVAA